VLTARVVQVARQADGSFIIDFEFKNASGAVADTDFFFIAIQTS